MADVSAALAQRTTEEWLERLLPLGIVVAGIKTLDQALHSEQTRARGMLVEVPAGDATLQLVGNPIKVLGVDEPFAEPPLIGGDNDQLIEAPAGPEAGRTTPPPPPHTPARHT